MDEPVAWGNDVFVQKWKAATRLVRGKRRYNSSVIRFALAALVAILTSAAVPLAAQNPVGSNSVDTVTNRPVAHECDERRPEWIFCDDFESGKLNRYFEYSNPDSSFVLADSVGVLGSAGMRVRFSKGQVDAGSLKVAFGKTPSAYMHPVDSGATIYREIYWRLYVRNDSSWTGGGGDKLSRAQVLVSPIWQQAMGAPVWSSGGSPPGANYLAIDPYSGTDTSGAIVTTTYNDFPHLRWLGAVRARTPIFDSTHVGKWYCVEAHVRLNDPGRANGVFEMWTDDWLEARETDLNWVGRFTDYGLNTVFVENYWNAGAPVTERRYVDNLVISTRRIGCGRTG